MLNSIFWTCAKHIELTDNTNVIVIKKQAGQEALTCLFEALRTNSDFFPDNSKLDCIRDRMMSVVEEDTLVENASINPPSSDWFRRVAGTVV